MASLIERLSNHTIDPDRKYFLDANVWIFGLGGIFNPTLQEKTYIDFLGELKIRDQKIYSHSLIFSEVFNALMRNGFDNYKENIRHDPKRKLSDQQISNLKFKKDFRGSEAYQEIFDQYKSDISIFIESISFLDKEFDFDFKYLTSSIVSNSDFNDYFYYEMALDLGLTIVTDDGDFNYDGISILTENSWLLK